MPRAEILTGLLTMLKWPRNNHNPDAKRWWLMSNTIATQGVMAKKVFIEDSLSHLAENTRADLEIEEVLGQISNIHLPFDKVWMEMPQPLSIKELWGEVNPNAPTKRWGALLVQREDCVKLYGYLSTYLTKEQALAAAHRRQMILPANESGLHLYIRANPVEITLSPVNGISMDDNSIIKMMGIIAGSKPSFDVTKFIDEYYLFADHVARLLVTMHATAKFPKALETTANDISEGKGHLSRLRLGRPPIINLRPIEIDATRSEQLKNGGAGARELLGWTSVRRSKPILKKDGTTYQRVAHDRRIPAAEDRRDVARIVKASQPNAVISLEAPRPQWSPPRVPPKAATEG